MLHLIPRPLHRLLFRIAHGLRLQWWRLRPPDALGVCVIAFDADGRLLLLRQSYGTTSWVLPGGGMRRSENAERAARREFEEEAGCGLRDMVLLMVSDEAFLQGRNRVHVFSGHVVGRPRPDGREIVDARYFALDALPADTDRRVIDRLALAGLYNSGN